ECFDTDASHPVVTLPVRGDKSRRGKEQPLPADVAELMGAYLDGKPTGLPVWPGTWASLRVAAQMLRRDLAEARAAWLAEATRDPEELTRRRRSDFLVFAVPGPDGPLYADFHALRHSYLTLGGRAGIDLRTLQELAGHSTSALTERYSHVR